MKQRYYPRHQQCPPIAPRTSSHMRSCSGCYESEDGHPVGDYPLHKKHGCYIGAGCRECQGRGIVRDYFPVPYVNWETGEEDCEALNFGDF